MKTIRFRPVLLGNSSAPAKVCYVREGDGELLFVDDNLVVPIEGATRLEDVTAEELPTKLTRTLPPLPPILLPIQEVQGETTREAMRALREALAAASQAEEKVLAEVA